MKIFKSISSFNRWRESLPPKKRIGFVPTMGALHEGHLTLLRRARKENDLTVVSIFVNPIQFGPQEDFKKYPRPWLKDLSLLKKEKVDAIFSPGPEEMYPPGFSARISVPSLSDVLCGRPNLRGSSHFDGVATVVAKLLNIVRPSRSYFGLKDYQQVRVIEQMVVDLKMPVRIVRCPTVREKSGLAMSSRNAYLASQEKDTAARIYAALQHGRKLLTSDGNKLTPGQICREVERQLNAASQFRVEYIELTDPLTLQRLTVRRRPALLAVAVRLGPARLIDNLIIN